MVYTQQGPFVNGGAPALAQGVFNAFDNWILSIDQPSNNNVAGTTAGSAQLYEFLTGTVKAFYLFYSGYRNSTATEQTITLPTAFTTYANFWALGGIPQTHILTGASQINGKIAVITSFASGSGAGGITANLNQMNGYEFGEITQGFDHIGLGVSQGQTFTAGLLVIGI